MDSSSGRVLGTISAGPGGAKVIAGINGGRVEGGAGNDLLYANLGAAAATARSHFTLDGESGTNALYGGGAFNVFEVGTALGGTNQVHGGLSRMSGVTGYHNNTMDFSYGSPTQSVYVDLLHGHNAYIYANNDHTGALIFEDAIRNVPNVIGSDGGDLIRADNTGDKITGGGGADIIYAGTGRDTLVYKAFSDSTILGGYDTIIGFQSGADKLDLSAFHLDASHLVIKSNSSATSLYLEQTAGHVHAATDLAIHFASANAIKASDIVF